MILNHDDQNHATSSREAEPPPDPPSLVGKVTLRMGDTTGPTSEKSISELDGADFWPEGATGQQVILVSLSSSDEVLAFGIFPAAATHTNCCRVPFVAWVQGTTAISAFRQKLIDGGAEVGDYSTAPLEVLQEYVTAFEQSLKPTLLSAMDWKRDSSNENDVKRPAA